MDIKNAFEVMQRINSKIGKLRIRLNGNYLLIFCDDKLDEVIPTDGTHKDRHPVTLEKLDCE